mmetsp:Transcript_8549/g.27235  ORF Transcript_8549/g.27235 Transcript_8549/m.27235 type:complete len:234 (-) Transcript_8549:954-1655(-)
MKTTLIGIEQSYPSARAAHHQAIIREIQLRATKLRKSGSFNFLMLTMFLMAPHARFAGFGLLSSSTILSQNSVSTRPTEASSTRKKLSARMPAESASSLVPRTSFQRFDITSTADLMASDSVLSVLRSSSEKWPSAAQSVQLRRHSLTVRTTFSIGSLMSTMTFLWLSSKPSLRTQTCITARRRSKSFSMARWSCIRVRTTPAEPQSKNSHQAAFRSLDSLSMSSRFRSSCEL